jgi:large subunit ribosomal protein L22
VPGLKTNERAGTRAVLRHFRMSASKARQVLDLIRDQDVERAAEILRTVEREAGAVIAKVLASAVANAVHNDGMGAEDLYVSACYADEGATLKRNRPRARGRASRIRKRTCHITIIVSRLPEDRLERRRAEREATGSRRSRRVSESRRRADLSGRLSRRRSAQAEAAAADAAEAEEQARIDAEAETLEAQATDAEVTDEQAIDVEAQADVDDEIEEQVETDEVEVDEASQEPSASDEDEGKGN